MNIKGGTDEKIDKILKLCQEKKVPYCFSCSRKEIGFALYGRKSKLSPKIACVSIINVEGFENDYSQILKVINKNKQEYHDIFCNLDCLNNTNTFGN